MRLAEHVEMVGGGGIGPIAHVGYKCTVLRCETLVENLHEEGRLKMSRDRQEDLFNEE
jgi:hypothetical protein